MTPLSSDSLAGQLDKVRRLESHLTFRISQMSKLLENQGAVILRDTGINLTGYRIMMIIGVFETITVSDLSRLMVIDRGHISRAANDLVGAGLVEYRAVPGNRRKKALVLTENGATTLAGIRPAFDARQGRLEAALGEADLAALWSILNKFSQWMADEEMPAMAPDARVRRGASR